MLITYIILLYSGKPGVVLVTSGPGATNVITAMADAQADGVPLIVFTGQVATGLIGTDAFQEGKCKDIPLYDNTIY
jgi:acetolactate synthase-1/2/3 large subunit